MDNENSVLTRDIQFHPVTDVPLHADFLRVSKGAKIAVMVAVEFINEDKSQGLKTGGILNVVRHEVELSVLQMRSLKISLLIWTEQMLVTQFTSAQLNYLMA